MRYVAVIKCYTTVVSSYLAIMLHSIAASHVNSPQPTLFFWVGCVKYWLPATRSVFSRPKLTAFLEFTMGVHSRWSQPYGLQHY